jgi:hypothetical protein
MSGYLHSALDRARARVERCQRELDRARGNLDASNEWDARTLRKLEDDLRRAETDASWFAHHLDSAEG